MVFPHVDQIPRHPSQLYQFFAEGVVLFVLVWLFSRKSRPDGRVAGMFALGYGALRFTTEFFREPDSFLGFSPRPDHGAVAVRATDGDWVWLLVRRVK
jgi:phosphatidylglycerol:prolipoprotein diacylglycerol transferase